MNKLKTAVIGVGYLGKFHAEKYANLDNSELVAVVDANAETAQTIADKYNVEALTDYKSLLRQNRCRQYCCTYYPASQDCQGFSRERQSCTHREADYRDR